MKSTHKLFTNCQLKSTKWQPKLKGRSMYVGITSQRHFLTTCVGWGGHYDSFL